MLPDGSFVIADLLDNHLLRYDASGSLNQTIELTALGSVNVTELIASEP